MELLSLLLNVGIVAYIVHLHRKQKPKRELSTPQAVLPITVEPPNPRDNRLDITGDGVFTVPLEQRAFVRGFGIRKEQVIDLVTYATPGDMKSFPEHVRGCLVRKYQEGFAFGVEAMELVCKGSSLLPGRALYFALVLTGAQSMPEIVAFVDKERPGGIPVEA
jgi:hypothetical protein